MKGLGIIITIIFLGSFSFAQENLFTCGKANEQPFNGWKITPYKSFKSVSFEENQIEFKREAPGDYNVEIERKITDLVGYDKLYLQLDYSEMDCHVLDVSVFFSSDGINWLPARNDSPFGPFFFQNEKMETSMVKIVFNTRFDSHSSLIVKSVFIQGKYTLATTTATDNIPEDFFKLFTFQNQVNIETNTTEEYEVLVMNMNGQIIYRSFESGSNRIVLESANTGYYVVALIQKNTFIKKEKVFIQN